MPTFTLISRTGTNCASFRMDSADGLLRVGRLSRRAGDESISPRPVRRSLHPGAIPVGATVRTLNMVIQQSRPPAKTWLLAALELIAALVVARLLVGPQHPPTPCHHHHHGMAGMPKPPVPLAHWGWFEVLSLGLAGAALGWWLLRREAGPAIVSAAALAVFAGSPAVRVLASHSHLIAMVSLELLMVACPLLLLRTRPRPSVARPARSSGWIVFAVAAAV